MRIAISLFFILVPIVVYIMIIRPRLKARYVDTYTELDNWWARQWARVVAFRTWIIGAIGLMLPEVLDGAQYVIDALQGLNGADVSFLPDWLQKLIRGLALVALLINGAFKTTPNGQPPLGTEPEKP